MINKRNSTISTKPKLDPVEQWINSEVETPKEAPATPEIQSASRHVDMSTKQQEDMPAGEATAMLSARVPVALIRQLRIRAATEGRSIQVILGDLLRSYLNEN